MMFDNLIYIFRSEKGSTRTSSTRKRNKRKSEAERDGKASKISKVEEDLPAPEQGKTLLEILELEMRARAIRALLKQGVDSEPRPAASREPNQSKNNGDIVDLTADEDFPTVVKIEPPTEQEKSFEDKVVKSSTATKPTETSKQVDAKKQRLIAEQDLRNKLIKKKTYRTRQQRIENLDEDVQNEVVEVSTEVPGNPVEELPEVLVKVEPAEIVIEDPEEGEVSSDEETSPPPVVVKVEKSKSPEPQTEGEKPMDGERITAMDDGEFVANENVEWTNEAVEMISPADVTHTVIDLENEPEILGNEGNQELEPEGSAVDLREDSEVSQQGNESNQSGTKPLTDLPIGEEEETTWRGRWLKKDEVQKVVKSSKICGLVKKRLKSKKAVAATLAEIPAMEPERQETETPPPLALLEGSVREYEELLRKKTEEKSGEGAESPVPSKGEVVPESPGQVVSEQTGGLQSEAESLAEPSTNVAEEMVETAVVESCSGDGVTSNPSDETQNQDKNQEKFTEEPSETKLETEQSEQTNR